MGTAVGESGRVDAGVSTGVIVADGATVGQLRPVGSAPGVVDAEGIAVNVSVTVAVGVPVLADWAAGVGGRVGVAVALAEGAGPGWAEATDTFSTRSKV
jgi:hypothetical protein